MRQDAKKSEDESAAKKKELALRTRFATDFEYYAPIALKIRPKVGKLVPFILNQAQQYLHLIAEKQMLDTGRIRILVLKGRQQGISTYIEGRFYWKTSHRSGCPRFYSHTRRRGNPEPLRNGSALP